MTVTMTLGHAGFLGESRCVTIQAVWLLGGIAVGQTATAQAVGVEPPHAVLHFQWLCNGVPIEGATSYDYVIQPDDAGPDRGIACVVTASVGAATSTARSSYMSPVTSGRRSADAAMPWGLAAPSPTGALVASASPRRGVPEYPLQSHGIAPQPYGIAPHPYDIEPPLRGLRTAQPKRGMGRWIIMAAAMILVVTAGIVGFDVLKKEGAAGTIPSAPESTSPATLPPASPKTATPTSAPAVIYRDYVGDCFSMTALAMSQSDTDESEVTPNLDRTLVGCSDNAARIRMTGVSHRDVADGSVPPPMCDGSVALYRCWWINLSERLNDTDGYLTVTFETIPHVGDCSFGYRNVSFPDEGAPGVSWMEYLSSCSDPAPSWMRTNQAAAQAADKLDVDVSDVEFTQFTIAAMSTENWLGCPADHIEWGTQYSANETTYECMAYKKVE